jgi:hypothetical protein
MSDRDNPLDRLTRPGGRPISDDESIPVLTERLTLPSLDLDISLPNPPPPVAEPPAPAPAPAPNPAVPAARTGPDSTPARHAQPSPAPVSIYTSAVPTEPPPEVDWAGIEQAVRDAVLAEVQPALADEAARMLRERLQPAIDRAVLALAAELRQAFEARLRETITRAVANEIARLRGRG